LGHHVSLDITTFAAALAVVTLAVLCPRPRRTGNPGPGASNVPAKRNAFSMDHPIVITFLIFAVIAFMSLAAEVLKPLALALLLSFALAPITRMLERRGLPRALSVILTVLLMFAALGLLGYQVGRQFTELTKNLPTYRGNILKKAQYFQAKKSGDKEGIFDRWTNVAREVSQALEPPKVQKGVMNVNVVSAPSFRERLQTAVGPTLEGLGVGVFVLILVLFLLMNREDLSDRVIRLAGQRRVSQTTKTMEEVGQRISRYLTMFATVNSAIGLVVGLGLWAIGVPLSVLWGVLAALLRFIPYVGPATAFVLPLVFSIASFPGWREPLMVVGLFAAMETLANTFLEPVIYGKTTGVSAFGLLVAAMFWTWLWGAPGLLLSTPMTVCLAVLGKYVPGLGAFATLLGEELPLEPDVRFYQRLLAMDQDGADAIIADELKKRPRAEVFDAILIPTLSWVERDRAHDSIDDRERAFVWRVIGDLLDDLEESPEIALDTLAPTSTDGAQHPAFERPAAPPPVRIVGVASNDHGDVLALRMLALLLTPSRRPIEILSPFESPLKLVERPAEVEPHLIVLSHLPPGGLTRARYLVRRLRARFAETPILVGRWGVASDPEELAQRLTSVGASQVVFRLPEARDRILQRVLPAREPNTAPLATSPA
jgi:predicted PurR-regulated permease PerM